MSDNPLLFDIPCVIFAGGRSSRMGEDKALLPFGDFTTLTEFQYRRLNKLFSKVYISTKKNKFDFKANLILDDKDEDIFAPTAGFEALFQVLQEERVFILSVDTPFVSEKEIEILLESDTPELDATIASTASGSHPMCGVYHRSLLPAFTQMLKEDNHRLGQLLKKSKTKFVMFEEEKRFANLNHPEEYKEALKNF